MSSEEFILEPSDPDFAATGLLGASKVKVTRIVTIERRLITRRIGKLSASLVQQLNIVIIQAFKLT